MILAAGVTLSTAPAAMGAAPSTPRHDSYVEITCSTETSSYLAKRVDASAIQPEKDPGGKDTATAEYNANNPFGEVCVEGAPIVP